MASVVAGCYRGIWRWASSRPPSTDDILVVSANAHVRAVEAALYKEGSVASAWAPWTAS